MRLGWLLALVLTVSAFGPVVAGAASAQTTDPQPHVIVGVADTGINPYHEDVYRPGLTEHPCTYIEGFPCSVQKLDLSIDLARAEGYQAALDQDRSTWDGLSPNTWYWIPQTPFVAVYCNPPSERGGGNSPGSQTCILDDGTDHGSATTTSVLRESPDTLLAFKQGGPGVQPFLDGDIPVDIVSVSWGHVVPVPLPRSVEDVPIYVKSAGNDPRPTPVDGWNGHPRVISVGGAYPERGIVADYESEPFAGTVPDIVSWFCRDAARAEQAAGSRTACGTSFASPTAAGALSKAILEVRRASGYTGNVVNQFVDPLEGVTIQDVREAMNRTATYDPQRRTADEFFISAPRVDHAPWVQWGWGFYDGMRADETAAHLLGTDPAPKKPLAARTFMHSVHAASHVWGDDDRRWSPDAEFTVTCQALTCTVDAAESSDPNGDALAYSWAFGDGSTATGETAEHTYSQGGGYEITLTVDDGHNTDEATRSVTVLPATALAVSTEKDSYASDEEITVTVEVTNADDGTPLEGVPVTVSTELVTPAEFWTDVANADFWLDRTETYNHETTVATAADGTATWLVPGDPGASPTGTHAPTGPGHIEVTATIDAADGDRSTTTYVVETPGTA